MLGENQWLMNRLATAQKLPVSNSTIYILRLSKLMLWNQQARGKAAGEDSKVASFQTQELKELRCSSAAEPAPSMYRTLGLIPNTTNIQNQ